MSETKTNEPVKQEGEFKLKKKTPKKLGITNNDPVKVDLTKPEATGEVVPDVVKVDIPKDDAIQIGETEKVDVGEQTGDSAKVDKQIQESAEDAQEFSPIQEITEEDEDKVKEIKKEIIEAKQDQQILNKPLPENIEKLIDFMESTGGTVEDYVALNKDYSSLDSSQLLSEYYKKTKPHLDQEEISFLMEDAFNFDEDVDEAREIRKKKLAYKEEVAKAKSYLESSKSKYYEEIKLKPSATGEQKEALNFYNNYKQQQELATKLHGDFRDNTKKLFSSDFKGFDFNVGDKKFRYGVKDPVKVGETQSDVQNFVSRFSNDEGQIVDQKGYHKAMYAAMNADKLAHHFYEQGKADGIKNVISSSKNPSKDGPRQVADGNVFINGLKVKSISGLDSSKLKIKTKKFN
tara:strand:+ start:3067 stop:4278 length:1212 start_codon:yes stop_codon:yes gene_type:complete